MDGVEQYLVDEAHHRGVVRGRCFLRSVIGAVVNERLQIECVQLGVVKVAKGVCAAFAGEAFDGRGELVGLGHDRFDGFAHLKLDGVQGGEIRWVRHGHLQAAAVLAQRQRTTFPHECGVDGAAWARVEVERRQVDDRRAELAAGGQRERRGPRMAGEALRERDRIAPRLLGGIAGGFQIDLAGREEPPRQAVQGRRCHEASTPGCGWRGRV